MRDTPQVTVANDHYSFSCPCCVPISAQMLRNAVLKNGVSISAEGFNAVCTQIAINPQRRGETLDIAEFAALANGLHQHMSKSAR